MALHNGIDTVSIVSLGVWSKTYGSTDVDNIADLHASFGLLEDAPEIGEIRGLDSAGFGMTMN